MRRLAWLACSLTLTASAVLGLPSTATAAQSMLDASTNKFVNGTPGHPITTRKVYVPAGGGLGVYGKNTNSESIFTLTRLEFHVYRDDSADVTNQFVTDYLNDDDVINQRIPVSAAHSYYIWATCVFVNTNPYVDTSCNGTFTISSWG